MKITKRIFFAVILAFLFLNGIAFFHAYSFTHFADARLTKTQAPSTLSIWQKLRTLAFGINNPRPSNMTQPKQAFETIVVQGKKKIECWYVPTPNSKGVVVIFHGFSGCKSMMLDRSDEWWNLGYSTFLVDFPGSGGSEGNETALGFQESEAVNDCFQYLQHKGEKNIILYGGSMGAVAVLKAIKDYQIAPNAVIVECPFGSLRQTTYARFNQMNLPGFPMADLLLFWGGVQQGFWAFAHNPSEYAKSVRVPVLLLYGGKDREVSHEEITSIFENLQGKKLLRIYPEAAHESYLKEYRNEWIRDVEAFIADRWNYPTTRILFHQYTSPKPAPILAIPHTRLTPIYTNAGSTRPDCSIVNNSNDNVENVVKPPQNPTASKKRHSSESTFTRSPHKAIIIPNINEPQILTLRVP
jgi:uncharacterized protein